MNIIFLDVDGVLNNNRTPDRSPKNYIGVEDKFIDNLEYIVNETGAEIVLSSDWKFEYDKDGHHDTDMLYLIERLSEHGLSIMDITTGDSRGSGLSGRGSEIAYWLMSNIGKHVKRWVILDDNLFADFKNEEIKKHLVLTVTERPDGSYQKGLTRELAEDAVYILKYVD